ncbi:MAG: ABC transporter permease [Chloroflexi bacterium]|nr:ABC transporter permease [Chloroflexota bacterium]
MTTITQPQARIEPARAPRGRMMRNVNAVAAIAYRDFLKFLRDRARILSTFLFPLIFIGFLGGGMQATFGASSGYNFLDFIFTGVLAQTLWQSTAIGIISLLEDRQNDFSQEIFVSPISRYAIVFGKILGETLVALPQGLGIVLFGIILGVAMNPAQLLGLALTSLIASLYGGAFGMMLLGLMPSRRAADQLFPFVFLPQFFTAGVFVPIANLPLPLEIVSRLSPLRYAVDLTRGVFYWNMPQFQVVVLDPLWLNVAIMGSTFLLFMLVGTFLFMRAEQNR